MKLLWSYLINQILVATFNNYRKAVRISIYHDSALYAEITDPYVASLYNDYHPLHLALVAAYDKWLAQQGAKQGETLSLNQLLRLLSGSKIKAWDIAIQTVYSNETADYKKLLPKNRIPFQKGSQSDRISYVKALSNAIGTDASLATVKADIDLFYTLLSEALTDQKGSKETTTNYSELVEAARVAMAQRQYYNLGGFMQKHFTNPEVIAKYYDLVAIRTAHQVLFSGHVNPLAAHFIVKHTFGLQDQIKIENKGATVLYFYLASIKGGTLPEHFITLQPGAQYSGLASGLGSLNDKLIMVNNPNTLNKGEYEFEFL